MRANYKTQFEKFFRNLNYGEVFKELIAGLQDYKYRRIEELNDLRKNYSEIEKINSELTNTKYDKKITDVIDIKCVLGVSGGMDSTLVNFLASLAFGSSNLYAYSLPTIYNSGKTKDAASNLPKLLDNHFEEIEIELEDDDGENGQAWKRALILQKKKGELIKKFPDSLVIILNTSNFSEIKLANFTINGDTIGDIGCLKELYKSEIYKLIDWILSDIGKQYVENNLSSLKNLDEILNCINSVSQIIPSAELKEKQSDSDVLLHGDHYYIIADMILIAKEYDLDKNEIIQQLISEKNFIDWASTFYKNAKLIDVAQYAIEKIDYRMDLTDYKMNNF